MNKDKIKIKLRHNQKPVVSRQVVLQKPLSGARETYLEALCGESGRVWEHSFEVLSRPRLAWQLQLGPISQTLGVKWAALADASL